MDIYELKKKASDLVKKEKFEKAIQIYEALLERFPNDTSLMLKLGNIHQTIGQERAALKVYSRAAEFFYDREMYRQGIAVCRLILKANPLEILAQKRLVDMYVKIYGGLPKKRGDTIMPPQFTRQYSSIPPANPADTVAEQGATSTSSRDSWQPVDIVFSDSDVDTSESLEVETDEMGEMPSMIIEPEEFENVPTVSADKLPPIPLLSPLEPEQIKAVVQDNPFMAIPSNTFILKEGDSGDSLYVIIEGLVKVLKGEDTMQSVARLGVGAFFGEMSMYGPRSRRASVVTIEPTIVMELRRAKIEQLQERYPAIRKNLRKYLRQRLLDNLLATCSLFTPFSKAHREGLKRHFFLREFESSEMVFNRDQNVNELFLIVDGSAEMFFELPGGGQELIRTMSIGEIFGEEPLVTDKPSKVTVQARESMTTMCLPKAKFKELIMAHPKIVSTVSELLGTIPPPPNPLP